MSLSPDERYLAIVIADPRMICGFRISSGAL